MSKSTSALLKKEKIYLMYNSRFLLIKEHDIQQIANALFGNINYDALL